MLLEPLKQTADLQNCIKSILIICFLVLKGVKLNIGKLIRKLVKTSMMLILNHLKVFLLLLKSNHRANCSLETLIMISSSKISNYLPQHHLELKNLGFGNLEKKLILSSHILKSKQQLLEVSNSFLKLQKLN